VVKKLFLFLLIISCSTTSEVIQIETESNSETTTTQASVKQSLTSEEILIDIFNAYKTFSDDPVKAVDIIWDYAHEDNKEITGPKERFAMMLASEPYDSIIDLKDYSYETIFESEENIHYEIKVLAQNNNYFVITWVFQKTLCDEKPCWRTIGVSQPEYFDSGI
jgi:hypothetical protein|tara:strand:- start:55 stop:546 length:492 start_codon:yes stop_codon:yes gene_type:complete